MGGKTFVSRVLNCTGDAYMVCSGLPTLDANHAINIANFALIVREIVGIVKSPLDSSVTTQKIFINRN